MKTKKKQSVPRQKKCEDQQFRQSKASQKYFKIKDKTFVVKAEKRRDAATRKIDAARYAGA